MKKRKFRLPALAMAVVLSIGGVGTAGACNTYVHAGEDIEIATGDVNSDNNINAEDALEALKFAAKLTELDENAHVRADVDRDKDVNAKDALYILQYAAHIISSFDEIKIVELDSAVFEAAYPEMELYANYEFDNAQYEKWNEDRSLQTKAYSSQYSGTLNNFFKTTIKGILEKDTNENVVFSPVNVYMAMAMIAETVDGEGRKEILDLIGVDSIENLRKQANAVWNAHYCDDGTIVSLLGNSLWLRDDTTYKNSLLKTLSDNYYVSSYRGNMSSEEYNSDLRSWLNKHTGGMLKEQIKDVKFDTSTLMAMYSTIYFRGKWDEEFWEGSTKEDVFYSPSGEIKCDYLIDEGSWQDYYWADKFSAVNKEIVYGGKMWFILPDEGVSPQEVINEEEYMKLIFAEDEWKNKRDDTRDTSHKEVSFWRL